MLKIPQDAIFDVYGDEDEDEVPFCGRVPRNTLAGPFRAVGMSTQRTTAGRSLLGNLQKGYSDTSILIGITTTLLNAFELRKMLYKAANKP